MPTYFDPDEKEFISALPETSLKIFPLPGLEAITGADFLVTTSSHPCTSESLVRFHLSRGAVLINRKSGLDFISSIGPRIKETVCRMVEFGARPDQCAIVSTGWYLPESNGVAVVYRYMHDDGRKPVIRLQKQQGTKLLYKSLITQQDELRRWGVSYINLARDEDFLYLFKTMEEKRDAEVTFFPQKPNFQIADQSEVTAAGDDMSHPFQSLRRADPDMIVLAAFDGFGPKKAVECINFWKSAAVALAWLSRPEWYENSRELYPRCITRRDVETVRKTLGGNVISLNVANPYSGSGDKNGDY